MAAISYQIDFKGHMFTHFFGWQLIIMLPYKSSQTRSVTLDKVIQTVLCVLKIPHSQTKSSNSCDDYAVWLCLVSLSFLLVPTKRCHYPLPPKARLHSCYFFWWPGKCWTSHGSLVYAFSQPEIFTAASAAACNRGHFYLRKWIRVLFSPLLKKLHLTASSLFGWFKLNV